MLLVGPTWHAEVGLACAMLLDQVVCLFIQSHGRRVAGQEHAASHWYLEGHQ